MFNKTHRLGAKIDLARTGVPCRADSCDRRMRGLVFFGDRIEGKRPIFVNSNSIHFRQPTRVGRECAILLLGSLTLTCGLTRYNNGLTRKRSCSSLSRRTSSRRAEPRIDTSSRLMAPVANGSCCTSGNDFFRCRVAFTGILCAAGVQEAETGNDR